MEEKQVDVQVLDMPLLDTRRRKNATTALMADMLLRLLSYMAQAERGGLSAAGRRKALPLPRPGACALAGRAPPVPEGFEGLKAAVGAREVLSSRQAAQQLHISHQTFSRWAKEK